jgi:hypothetical protein
MSDVKIFRRLALKLQTGSSYEDTGMFLIPFTSETMNQTTNPIADDSIIGEGFSDIPLKGCIHAGGPISQNCDVVSCAPIFEVAMGSNVGGVYTFTNHTKKLSTCSLNAVSANKYANSYPKGLKISGSVDNLIKLEYTLFGTTPVVRDAINTFPTGLVSPGEPFTFHEMGGSLGFFRVGDAVDSLSSSDNISIEEFSIDMSGGFDEQFDNVGRTSLIPVYGMTPFTLSGSFKVSRFATSQWLTWGDELTPLQLSLKIAKTATKYIQIDIPRFTAKVSLSEDDLTRVDVEMQFGRNGTGTNYKNTNMPFVSPMRITVVNT